jgi:hypothetical protein
LFCVVILAQPESPYLPLPLLLHFGGSAGLQPWAFADACSQPTTSNQQPATFFLSRVSRRPKILNSHKPNLFHPKNSQKYLA